MSSASATVPAAADNVAPNVSIQKFPGIQLPEPSSKPPPNKAVTGLGTVNE